jgi:hypothetical protein
LAIPVLSLLIHNKAEFTKGYRNGLLHVSDPMNCSTSFIEIYYERLPPKTVGQFEF